MFDIVDELRRLVVVLDEHEVDYALCGGMAMAVHGHLRDLVDIKALLGEGSDETG